jgi:hypothetical protein
VATDKQHQGDATRLTCSAIMEITKNLRAVQLKVFRRAKAHAMDINVVIWKLRDCLGCPVIVVDDDNNNNNNNNNNDNDDNDDNDDYPQAGFTSSELSI